MTMTNGLHIAFPLRNKLSAEDRSFSHKYPLGSVNMRTFLSLLSGQRQWNWVKDQHSQVCTVYIPGY